MNSDNDSGNAGARVLLMPFIVCVSLCLFALLFGSPATSRAHESLLLQTHGRLPSPLKHGTFLGWWGGSHHRSHFFWGGGSSQGAPVTRPPKATERPPKYQPQGGGGTMEGGSAFLGNLSQFPAIFSPPLPCVCCNSCNLFFSL